MIFRIDRAFTPAQFEMQLRLADIARPAHPGNDLATTNDVAALYENYRAVRIGRHPAACMFDQNQIAKSLQLITGIGNDTIFRCPDRCTLPRGDINAIIMQTTGAGAERLDDFSPQRPQEFTAGSGWWIFDRDGIGLAPA